MSVKPPRGASPPLAPQRRCSRFGASLLPLLFPLTLATPAAAAKPATAATPTTATPPTEPAPATAATPATATQLAKPATEQAAQPASETAEPALLLVAAPLPEPLRLRLLSYLDPKTATLRVDPHAPADATRWPAYAAANGALGVVSFSTEADGTLVIMLSPAKPEAASQRRVPLSASPTSLERSAAYESAALITTSMLEELLTSTPPSSTLSKATLPPTPTRSTTPSSPPTSAATSAATAQPEAQTSASSLLSFRLAGGYGVFFNWAAPRTGPRLEAGTRYGALSASLAASLLSSNTTELTSAGVGQIRVATREWLLAAPIRWHIPLSRALGAGVGLAPAVSWVTRSSRSLAPNVAETPETGLLTAQLEGFGSFYWTPQSSMALGMDIGIAGLLLRPKWTLRDAQDRSVARQQWASLQPIGALWFAWVP